MRDICYLRCLFEPMKFKLLVFLILSLPSQLLWAQSIQPNAEAPVLGANTVFYFDNVVLKNQEEIKQFIINKCAWFSAPNNALLLTSIQESPLGQHYTFSQQFKNHTIFYNGAKVSVAPNGKLIIASINMSPINNFAFDGLSESFGIMFHFGNPIPAIKIDFINQSNNHIEAYLSQNADTIYQFDRKLYLGKDTIVKGNVFLPNPVQSAKVSYGIPYVNANNTDVPVLISEQKSMPFKAMLLNDTFVLRSKYLSFGEVSGPYTQPAWSITPVFNFYRSNNFFEDVNAFYHLTNYTNYLTQKGFINLLDNIVIDAHSFNGGDNSAFDPAAIPYTLEYGTGGVQDAEDGQVVVHEFGHAMSQVASPNTVIGSERSSMEEGNSDYFCVSYSRTFNNFNWEKVFTWDGHNEFWDGFVAKTNKKYPKDLTNNSNDDREIWNSALMCIYEKIGASVTDSLVMLHLPLQAVNTTMPQMARVLLRIDTLVWQAKHTGAILNCFVEQGILGFAANIESSASQSINLLNSNGFKNGEAPLIISNTSNETFNVKVFDNLGNEILNTLMQNELRLDPNEFESGIYYLQIMNAQSKFNFKIMKL